ncbi:MAG TPA: type II secretion system protein [Burkholderiales bacterium]|nr:type II secretion system protein [Burkholderiales bacterium]
MSTLGDSIARKRRQPRAGFTLIELVITVAIIGILLSVAMPFAELAVKRAKEQELRVALRQIRTALDEYKKAADQGRVTKKADESGYPPSLTILVEGVRDARAPSDETMIYFMRRLPRDPFNDDPDLPAADTWGKRSYQSPPDQPEAGKDVFDVYSLSDAVGINGIPYKQW